MPLIPNYIARLRTHSQSTAASSSRSNSTAGPSTPGSELARLAADPLPQLPERKSDQTIPPIARKIHPNPSALLAEDVPSEDVEEDMGPRAPRGRSRSTEQFGRMASQRTESQERQASELAATASSSRSRFFSRILSLPVLGGVLSTPPSDVGGEPDSGAAHWSTFGRRRPPASAAGEFGSLHRSESGSKGSAQSKSPRRRPQQKSRTATPSTTYPPSTSARMSTPSRAQTNETQSNSPAGTLSSSSKSHSLRSRQPLFAHPEPIMDAEPLSHADPQTPTGAPIHGLTFAPSPDNASSLVARLTLDDTPQTFGRGTPKESGSASRTYPRIGGGFVTQSTDNPREKHKKRVHHESLTFPQRRRTRSRPTIASSISFPSLPNNPATAELREEDETQVDSRRWSASWSAAEAVKGVDGEQNESWPVTVSREMVRLSLRSRGLVVGREEAFEASEVGTMADGAYKNAMLFGSTGEDRRHFMKAGRRRANTDSAAPAQSSSASPRQSTLQPSVSPPTASNSAPDTTPGQGSHKGRLAPYVSVTAPTPSPSPSGSRFATTPEPTPGSRLDTNPQSQGKRKITDAEDEESARRPQRSLLSGSRDSSNRASETSQAPSSYRQNKRIRLSTPSHSPEHLSRTQSQSSHLSPPGSPSRPPSLHTADPRTTSQSSIPFSAIVSPRPPSIDRRSVYHMRDPALPPTRRQSTQWVGSARRSPTEGRRAFPLQGWAFMLGFVLFPMWWVAAVAPVGWGWGRRSHEHQNGKGVWMSEENIQAQEIWEYDVASTWRRRCRLMSLLGLLVYIPLIVLLAVLVPRP